MEPPTHIFPTPLALGKGFQQYEVIAQYSVATPRAAVVFVHGFLGSATGTWPEFTQIVQNADEKAFHSVDFYFFGYYTLLRSASFSGGKLEILLQRVMTKPLSMMNTTLGTSFERPEGFQYNQLIVVAHSLGAMVSRFALIAADTRRSAWCDKVRLAFFAPAHLGASIQEIAIKNLAPLHYVTAGAAVAALIIAPTTHDLAPGGEAVRQLQRNTARLLGENRNRCHIAKAVVQAEFDRVVELGQFEQDPPPILADGRWHMNVKNPTEEYTLPVEVLADVLNAP
jgi:pimeloyl-ACP methyl ester carboxylesterase